MREPPASSANESERRSPDRHEGKTSNEVQADREIGVPVAIAGCGAVSAVGCGIEPLRVALQKNVSGLRPLEKFNSPRFQSNIVGASPRALDDENPAWSLATEALKQACESSRLVLEKIPAERIGFVLSTTKANIEALERISENRPCSETARRHLQADLLAADLAATHGARGPVQTISVACVSGLIAIQQGTRMIQRGEADAVLVVGVDCLSEFVMAGFTALKALDPLGCRPFDAARCGLSPGEAGAAIVLVRAGFGVPSRERRDGSGTEPSRR